MFDETIRQSASDGTPFPKLLEAKGIIPGIKVDKGAKPLALAEGETVTEGLDGLRQRLAEYRDLGEAELTLRPDTSRVLGGLALAVRGRYQPPWPNDLPWLEGVIARFLRWPLACVRSRRDHATPSGQHEHRFRERQVLPLVSSADGFAAYRRRPCFAGARASGL
jgi:hypothetical protein